jgi:hypothetical protein
MFSASRVLSFRQLRSHFKFQISILSVSVRLSKRYGHTVVRHNRHVGIEFEILLSAPQPVAHVISNGDFFIKFLYFAQIGLAIWSSQE